MLFVIPKTMRKGFILLSCYFEGVMTTEPTRDTPMLNTEIPLILI